jgi:hypothetical protein
MGRRRAVLWFARWRIQVVMGVLAAGLAVPAVAHGEALPDGRVYEQVSPAIKDGSDAGAPSSTPKYSVATADGNGVLYGTRGPMGTVHRGLQFYAVAHRGADGWVSESALPSGSADRIFAISYAQSGLLPSEDLKKIIFAASASYVPENPVTLATSAALYMGHADGAVDWLSRPVISNPIPAPGSIPSIPSFQTVGASPDLNRVYFWSGPTLLPEDAARTPFYDPSDPSGAGAWGLYEYSDGVLKAAGTLPDGSQDPGGAAPASSGSSVRVSFNFTSPETTSHQVSRDGSVLLFVSPDPGPDPAQGPATQLYVRRNGQSKLVSHTPTGAKAPSGVTPVQALNPYRDPLAHEYAYGSADGKTVIFQSIDALAPGAPSDSSQKAYRYDVETEAVSYLPGVHGTIVASSDDDRRFLFADDTQIAVWDAGTIKTVAPVNPNLLLSPARATKSGSVFLFTTKAAIPGFNSGGQAQIYRYDVEQGKTECVSCPPDGIAPSGDARLTNQDSSSFQPSGELVPSRGMTDDGRRVFFDTPDALVSRDTNVAKRDVYEWTPGGVSLVSSGRSQDDSFFLDSSADGQDVFFATSEGLVGTDKDGSYDVYDARVGGGFTKVDQAAPCQDDACQGSLSGAASVPVPGSAHFSGAGNLDLPNDASKPAPTAKLKLGTRKVTGGTLEVSVRIARPGLVTVSGGGLRNVGKTYAKPGTFKVRATLTAAAKRALKAKRRLRLSVRVGFTPSSGAASSVKFILNAKA